MQKIVCFLVDDDADDQEIFQIAVSELDLTIEVVTADDGYLALEHIRANDQFLPDFIFLDLNMPRVDGKQCLGEIRKISRFNEVPIIIYSTSSQQHHKEEVSAIGATDFVTKPSELSKLKIILNEIFTKTKQSSLHEK